MKKTVQALIFNEEGEILAVSRKTDHNDFGLAGGKVDEEDYNSLEHVPLMAALVREVKEETGININADTAELVFAIHKDGYMGYTYLISEWSGEIETDEPHVVKFTHFREIMEGSFGRYNSLVAESLKDLGFEFKMDPTPVITREYVFSLQEDDYGDGGWLFFISPKYENEDDAQWAYYDRNSEEMEDEISNVLARVKTSIDYLDEASMKLYDPKNMEREYTKEEVCKFLTDAGIARDKFDE